jgi:hypothetical protein
VFLVLNAFGLGWPALSGAATFVRIVLWAAALALVVSLGGLAAPRLSAAVAVACIAALILWLPCLWLGAVVLGVRRANYLGRRLPAASGIMFALVAVPSLWLTGAAAALRLSGCVVMLALMIVGLIDDLYAGGRQARGLRGHLGALARGRVTTGAVKAAGGLAAGLAAGGLLHPGDPVRIALDALLVALGANLINLLDLRPGRALKAFGLLSGAVIALEPNSLRLLGPVLAAAVVSAPSDLAGRTMMGDTGSNVLGGAIGLALASSLPLGGCIAAVAVLIAIHLLCERISLTDIIGRSRILRFVDQLGTAHLPPLPAGGEVTE